MKRILLFAVLLVPVRSASAAWYPVVGPTQLWLEVGETGTFTVQARWTGIWVVPWHDWDFGTTDPRVATADGRMTSSRPYDVSITGLTPGTAYLTVYPFSSNYGQIVVVCGKEDPIHPAMAKVLGTFGDPVTLQAITPIAHRTTFAWYRGPLGNLSAPIAASGPTLTYTPTSRLESVWVLATTPCSSSTAEFRVEVPVAKRRSVRR